MSTETYKLSDNLNNKILVNYLKNQINNDEPDITSFCTSITIILDDVNILFANPLSANEKIVLDNIVYNHNQIFETPNEKFRNIYLIVNPIAIKNTSYQEFASFVYDGLIANFSICKIDLIVKGSDYSIRLYDNTNKITIFEKNYSNNQFEEYIIDSSMISNLPESQATITLQVKNNTNTKSWIKLFQIKLKLI